MSHQSEVIESLLQQTKSITDHQQEIKNLRGESFNVFSILKLESKENEVHSTFLGELLNPKGSHLFKTLFLEYFLAAIDYKGALDISSTKVELEKHLGSRNDQEKKGGRIDIYISDAKGNSISIENKIYAGDQFAQIERYVNYNKNHNTVYYLTLEGLNASEESKGGLKEEHDYFCISYKETIIKWLNKCMKAAVEQAILRESIRQYILLIKKLTNQLSDNKMDKEIQELIVKNYSTVKIITDNLWKIELEFTVKFLLEIKDVVEENLQKGWTVTVDENLDESWSGLRVTRPSWNGILVKLEGQSKMTWQTSVYGIHADKNSFDRSEIKSKLANVTTLQNGFKESHAWPFYKHILNFNSTEERSKLFDPEQKFLLVKEVSGLLIELARECELPLANIRKL